MIVYILLFTQRISLNTLFSTRYYNINEGGSASALLKDDQIIFCVSKEFVNGDSKIENGYLHILDSAIFKKRENSELVSQKTVEPVFVFEVFPSDLPIPIQISLE